MRVLETRQVTRAGSRTRIIQFDLGAVPLPFRAGQAVMVGLPGSPVRSPYSIACSPGQAARDRVLELLVQVDDSGKPDPHLERLEPGSLVEVDGPFGEFGLPDDIEETDILFVAGGTGIAPLRSMLWDLIERDPAKRLSLIYSVRSADEAAYETEFEQLGRQQRVDVRLTVTREHLQGWLGPRGRIDAKLIASVLRTPHTLCALCGPPAMVSNVTDLLRAAGVSNEQILTEAFST